MASETVKEVVVRPVAGFIKAKLLLVITPSRINHIIQMVLVAQHQSFSGFHLAAKIQICPL
jgi:hypothetical protein